MADAGLTDDAKAAIRSAADALSPHADHPQVAGLISKLSTIADADDEDSTDLMKAMQQMEDLKKSEDLPAGLRKQAGDVSRKLQLEYLAKSNPRAARAWEEAQEARAVR